MTESAREENHDDDRMEVEGLYRNRLLHLVSSHGHSAARLSANSASSYRFTPHHRNLYDSRLAPHSWLGSLTTTYQLLSNSVSPRSFHFLPGGEQIALSPLQLLITCYLQKDLPRSHEPIARIYGVEYDPICARLDESAGGIYILD